MLQLGVEDATVLRNILAWVIAEADVMLSRLLKIEFQRGVGYWLMACEILVLSRSSMSASL